jgi:uncharacterized delta-60 repeat protein
MRRPGKSGPNSSALMERLEPRVQFAAGALNTAVNLTGIVKKTYRSTNDFIDTVAQADGKIVCVGDVQASGQTKDVVLARFNANGSPDTTFGTNGLAFLSFTSTSDEFGTAVAIDPVTKRIVIAGVTGTGTKTDMFVARFLTTGRPDTTFGTAGKTKIDFGSSKTDGAVGLVVQKDSKVVVSGYSGSVASLSMAAALARLRSNGTLDTTFGSGGKVAATTGLGLGTFEVGARMAQQADGKYVVAVTRLSFSLLGKVSSTSFGAARFTTNGLLDLGFGSLGRALKSLNKVNVATSVAIDPTTKNIVVGGAIANGVIEFGGTLPAGLSFVGIPKATIADFGAARFKAANGAADTTFSGDGVQTVNFKTGTLSRLDGATSVQVDSASRVYLVGASQLSAGDPDFAAARLKSNGILDTAFDGDGMRLYNIGGSDGAFGSFRSSTQLFVVGHSKKNAGQNFAVLVSILT